MCVVLVYFSTSRWFVYFIVSSSCSICIQQTLILLSYNPTRPQIRDMSRDSELQTSFSTSRLYQSVSYSGLRNLAQLTWLLVQKSRPQIRNPNQSRFTGAKNYGLKTEIWLSVLMKEMREWSRQLKNFVCIEGS